MSKNFWINLSIVLMVLSVFSTFSLAMHTAGLERQLTDSKATIAELQKRPNLPEFLNNLDILDNESAEFVDFPGNYSVVWKPCSAKDIAEGRADHYEGMYLSAHADRKFIESGYLMYIRYSPQPLRLK